MLTRIVVGLVALVWMATTASTSMAQDAHTLLNELYGRGVHAYFNYNYEQAQKFLDTAVASGSRDPRCYYFRGLTLVRLGRSEEADQQFRVGSTLEFSSEGAYNVPRALERIQGYDRLKLEQVRREARLAWMRQPRQMRPSPNSLNAPPGNADAGARGPVQPARADIPLPIQSADGNDPFVRDTSGPIGAETIEVATPPSDETTPASATDTVADRVEDPFGADVPQPPRDTAMDAPPDAPFGQTPAGAESGTDKGTASGPGLFEKVGSMVGDLLGGNQGAGTGRATTPPVPADSDDPFQDADQPADDVFGQPATTDGPETPLPPPAEDDPFSDADQPATADGTEAPPPPPPPADDDPFSDANQPANDALGQPATTSGPETPPPPADAPETDDPFGGDGNDPFGEAEESNEDPVDPPPAADSQPDDSGADNSESEPATSGESDDGQTDPFADDEPDSPF